MMTPLNTESFKKGLVSIVVTTKNEEKNIENCLKSIRAQTWKDIELIVVDNHSTDATKTISLRYTPLVFEKGPERSAQRNFGLIEKSHGQYSMYVDADMILSPRLVERCVERMSRGDCVALHLPEIVLGTSFWSQVRRFERSFYDGTVIDGARFFDKIVFEDVGGFDENLNGPEDWDLDKKLKGKGPVCLLDSPEGLGTQSWDLSEFIFIRGGWFDRDSVVFHNEADFNFKKYLVKKKYYSTNFQNYVSKWGSGDPDLRKQFGWHYRFFYVFIEDDKWKKLFCHPLLSFGMYFLRICVGVVYFLSFFGSTKSPKSST